MFDYIPLLKYYILDKKYRKSTEKVLMRWPRSLAFFLSCLKEAQRGGRILFLLSWDGRIALLFYRDLILCFTSWIIKRIQVDELSGIDYA